MPARRRILRVASEGIAFVATKEAPKNPWHALPSLPPFVLPEDAAPIASFNARARPEHSIHLNIVPEPFLGDPAAPVVLLNLNPGFSADDTPVHLDATFNAAARANLLHAHESAPFYLLDPALPSPGQRWWYRRLRALTEAVGSIDAVARGVFVAEVHGYHSVKYRHQRTPLASQAYTQHLVNDAVGRGAMIIAMRGLRIWRALVPALDTIQVHQLRSVQNTAISPRNCPDAFDDLVANIRAMKSGTRGPTT